MTQEGVAPLKTVMVRSMLQKQDIYHQATKRSLHLQKVHPECMDRHPNFDCAKF